MLAIEPQALDFSYLYSGCTPNDRTEDNVAIVRVYGPLEHHKSPWWDSYEAIVGRVEDAMTGQDIVKLHERNNWWRDGFEPVEAIPASAVVMCFDSPGGEAAGATWGHRKLRSLRQQYDVPLFAYANEMACSAAYEMACAADEVWLPDTGTVGSIGVIATLFDRTQQNEKMGLRVELLTSGSQKADNHADRVIDDDIRRRMEARVMSLAQVFWRVVARARGTTPKAVADLEAGVFIGQDAVDVGIADGISSWDTFLNNVAASVAVDQRQSTSTPTPGIAA